MATRFEEKRDRLKTAMNKGTPDRVPVFPIMDQYAVLVNDINLIDAYTKNPFLPALAVQKMYERGVYLDGIYGTSNMIPFDAIKKMGEGVYTLQEKGIMTKGSAGVTMSPEEYPELIKDPYDFLLSTAMPRKFDLLQAMSREEVAKTLRAVLLLTGVFEIYDKTSIQIIEKFYQTPVVAKACMMIPQCIILDYLRDFAGISRDIRRQPEDVLAASNAMLDVILPALVPQGKPGKDGFSNVFIPLHLPTFLRPDDYKNYYQPTFKYVTQYLLDKGYNVVYFMEADWTPYLDYLQELPDGNITCIYIHSEKSAQQTCNDRRDYPTRQSVASGRNQGENPRCQALRYHRHHLVRRKPQRHRRYQTRISRRRDFPLCKDNSRCP